MGCVSNSQWCVACSKHYLMSYTNTALLRWHLGADLEAYACTDQAQHYTVHKGTVTLHSSTAAYHHCYLYVQPVTCACVCRRTLEILGPAFIKWGQWAATRRDVFPPDLCKELERLHSHAPKHSLNFTQSVIRQAFAGGTGDLFSSLRSDQWRVEALPRCTEHGSVTKGPCTPAWMQACALHYTSTMQVCEHLPQDHNGPDCRSTMNLTAASTYGGACYCLNQSTQHCRHSLQTLKEGAATGPAFHIDCFTLKSPGYIELVTTEHLLMLSAQQSIP